jgi:hypothetical protein
VAGVANHGERAVANAGAFLQLGNLEAVLVVRDDFDIILVFAEHFLVQQFDAVEHEELERIAPGQAARVAHEGDLRPPLVDQQQGRQDGRACARREWRCWRRG